VFLVLSQGSNQIPPHEPGEGVPENYSLQQNYPNPFNPSTRIIFDAPYPGWVKLAVYDVQGREVARPVDGWLTPGTYTVVFDAEGLAAGTYYYRLNAAGFVATKKMVLVR
jgi:hypothetical protein